MDIVDRLEGAFASTGKVVGRVTPQDLGNPTPCAEWDVRALLNHTTGVVLRFAATASRATETSDAPDDLVGTDPSAMFTQATETTLTAWSQPGALDGTCRLPVGIELPAHVAAGINFVDTLVHGWDLAKSLNLDPTLDPALAGAALEIAKMIMSDDLRGPGKAFGPNVAVAGGASPTDQLVSFLGRQP